MTKISNLLKLSIHIFFLTACYLVFQGCSSNGSGEIIRIGHPLPEEHPLHQSLLEVKDYLARNNAEGIDIRIFPNGQLGSASDHVQMISAGQIQVGVFSASTLSGVIPMMNIFSLPFLFHDTDHMREVLEGDIGHEILEYLNEHKMFGFGYFTAGSRNIMAKKPILKPEDLSGLNIRVMESVLLVQIIRAMGGSAVVMGTGDVYSALQQGLLDGWENNPPTAYFFRMHETGANHFSWTRHLIIPDVILASNTLKERLSKEQFSLLEKAFRHAIDVQWREWESFTEKSIKHLHEAGMKFHEVDEQAFKEKVGIVYNHAFERYGGEFQTLVEKIQEIQ